MIKEIYYWMVFYLRKMPSNDMPQFNSYLLISLMVYFNIASIFIIIRYLLNLSIKINSVETTYLGLCSALCVGLFCYFFTFKQRKDIQLKYVALSKERKIRGQIIFWFYIVLSISLLFTLGPTLVR